MAGVEVTLETAQAKYAEIEQLDEVISAASGSAEAGKRKIANELVSETETAWSKSVTSLLKSLESVEDPRVLVGSVTAITNRLRDAFGSTIDTFLNAEVEARKTDSPEVSPEELSTALETRKEAVKTYNILKQLLEAFGNDVSSLPEPKRMTGPRGPQGKRGPRLPKNLQFAIDGKDRSATQNSLSSIANTVCKDLDWSTKDLKSWLTEQGFDPENVPATFEYTLPNGKVLSGRLTDDVPEDDDEDDDTEVEEVEE